MARSPTEYRQLRFTRPSGATELLLVRHGESDVVREEEAFPLTEGHGDPGLSQLGRTQAALVADRLAKEEVAAIYVSILRRTAETAEPLAQRTGLQPVVEPDLREVYLGEWEGGLFRKHVSEQHPTALRMWAEERWDVIPGAEHADVFAARVRAVIETIASRHPDQCVVVFTHGGVIGQALADAARSRPFAFTGSDNCGVSHLVVAGDRWMLRRFNDTAHLHLGFTTQPEPLT